MGWRAKESFITDRDRRFFAFHSIQTGSGVHQTSCTVGTRTCVRGIKQPLHEIDHLTPSNPVVKNAWSCSFTSQSAFVVWCLIKDIDGYIFLVHMHELLHMSGTTATYMISLCECCIITIIILYTLVQSKRDHTFIAWNSVTLTDSFKL
jgi:hypothetical protein